MPYDENSFLQGIAVGRSMKGVTVIGGGDGRDILRAVSSLLAVTANIPTGAHELPGSRGEALALASYIITLDGTAIDVGAAVDTDMGLGSIGAAAAFSNFPVIPYSADTLPGTLHGTVGASAEITINY